MIDYKMELTPEQIDILSGKQGETLQKVMETVVLFGDIFGAKRLVPVTYKDAHLVTSFGLGVLKPLYATMDQLIEAGLKTQGKFTVDPRPIDYENVKCNFLEKFVFNKKMYSEQEKYEAQLQKVGLKDKNGFTCTCYYPEVGNRPSKGDVLTWAESSAVVFANSVLGAKCNRNSGMLDLFGAILGLVPEFGFLIDENRKAHWKVTVKTTKKPLPQILGSAIGMKCMEDVPYVVGLDQWIGTEITDEVEGYLKDFGAATASNGAVGLYHIENLTPEAKEQGEALLRDDYKEYVIDDAELERIYLNYPIMWKDTNAKPQLVFIGCPHLTYQQLCEWTDKLVAGLKETGKKKLTARTVLTTTPDVADKFRATAKYQELLSTGATLASICPLMYTNNPICMMLHRVATNSNKLRTYSKARYYKDDELLNILTGKEGK